MADPNGRRPLKSRSTRWAMAAAAVLVRIGVSPNFVSVASVGFAVLAGAAILEAGKPGTGRGAEWTGLLWFGAAIAIQLRLLCNLLDGMLAVEGGMRTPNGELYNEIPDRLADVVVLAALGYAVEWQPGGALLGWTAASGALTTAYVRALGAALTGGHDFVGPFAKPHRMAVATAMVILAAILTWIGRGDSGAAPPTDPDRVVVFGLVVLAAGTVFTAIRRILRLSHRLRSRSLEGVPGGGNR